ncbi:MAG: hypothetical protein J6W75_09115 [Bacteroidaceae bacterium]|nr:hypothetical protein [Bacteroidaceae bacterium]
MIASRVLLAVLLPMWLLSSLHIHPIQPSVVEEDCADCVQHHCGGHIGQEEQTMQECVLCQFLSLPKVVAEVVNVVLPDCLCKLSYAQCQPTLLPQTLSIIVTRGPPAV